MTDQNQTNTDSQQNEELEDKLSVHLKGVEDGQLKLPDDLYIPPDALKVILEAFEGPLDLLLYFIKRQNLDILDIPVAKITEQYMEYIELMQGLRFELAAEYLVMAATLAEIKSRMLLPRPQTEEGEEEDPRAELIRRLQEYERFKTAAENLDAMPRIGRDTAICTAETPKVDIDQPQPSVDMKELMYAFQNVMHRAEVRAHHQIKFESLSVRDRMNDIVKKLESKDFLEFAELFNVNEGRIGVVVSFIAMLELVRNRVIDVVQSEPLSPIHVRLERA
ncbi:MAG: segregation and condensation protein A [Gammaproteobacteria bacterium]